MDKYQRIKVLGTGSFGTAMLVRACASRAARGMSRTNSLAAYGRGERREVWRGMTGYVSVPGAGSAHADTAGAGGEADRLLQDEPC
jgi:hypothetical protein